MMKYAFFKGCQMPHALPGYEYSTRMVFERLGIMLVDLDFTCCGHKIKDQDEAAFLFTAIRNIALAEKQGLTIMTPCKCCFGNLMNARHRLSQDPELEGIIRLRLSNEGLSFTGGRTPRHLLSVLKEDIGVDTVKKMVRKPLAGVKVAAHYGCHALRPSQVVKFDNPFAPTVFEDLIRATGAEPVDWSRRLECCGNPILEKNRELSLTLMRKKFESAKAAEADRMCTACTYCQIQFDAVAKKENPDWQVPTPQVVTDLLAESFGMI